MAGALLPPEVAAEPAGVTLEAWEACDPPPEAWAWLAILLVHADTQEPPPEVPPAIPRTFPAAATDAPPAVAKADAVTTCGALAGSSSGLQGAGAGYCGGTRKTCRTTYPPISRNSMPAPKVMAVGAWVSVSAMMPEGGTRMRPSGTGR